MNYTLKDKIIVDDEFLNDLIAKSWQEAEAIQQQIANIDTSTRLGVEVTKLLKNTCTDYYVFIGCLESLAENTEPSEPGQASLELDAVQPQNEVEMPAYVEPAADPEESIPVSDEADIDFEPFEYFTDFDEPIGEPISDADLYG